MRLAIVLTSLALIITASVALAESDADGNMVTGEPTQGTSQGPTPIPYLVEVFDNQADFLAAAGVVTTEDFEDEATTATCNSGAASALSFDDFDASSTPAALKILDAPCYGNHNTTPGGLKFLSADTDQGGVSADVLFTFNASILKLGLYLVDLEEPVEITINGSIYGVPAGGDGSEQYFGIIETTPFTEVSIRVSQNYDSHNTFDDIAYGTETPTPAEDGTWGSLKAVYH